MVVSLMVIFIPWVPRIRKTSNKTNIQVKQNPCIPPKTMTQNNKIQVHNTTTPTLPKTNIAPTNGWLEYYFLIGEAYFQGLR